MTPVEIAEYKQRWKPGYTVGVHSDNVNEAKAWCRKYLDRHEWSMTEWTDVYEHTFHFEYLQDATMFKNTFWKYADLEK